MFDFEKNIWFLDGVKVRVENSFFIENLKMDIGQFFQLTYRYCCETIYKVSFGKICSIWVCAK